MKKWRMKLECFHIHLPLSPHPSAFSVPSNCSPVLWGPSNPTSVIQLLIIETCTGWSAFHPGGFKPFSSEPSLIEKPCAILGYKTEKRNTMPICPTLLRGGILPCIDLKLHLTRHPALFSRDPIPSFFIFLSPQQSWKIPGSRKNVLTFFLSLMTTYTDAESAQRV